MYLVFDTETTGLPKNYKAPVSDSDNWPRCVQLAWQIHDESGELVEVKNYIIKPEGYTIPFSATKIHGISTERAEKQGVDLQFVLDEFNKVLDKCQFVVGHNIEFDINIVGAEYHRKSTETKMMDISSLDTCSEKTALLCQIPGGRGGKFKLPQLGELHQFLFQEKFAEAHNASADVEATTRCFLELIRREQFTEEELQQEKGYLKAFRDKNREPFELIGLNIQPYSAQEVDFTETKTKKKGVSKAAKKENIAALEDVPFSHLHNHTQFSVLQATIQINNMVKKAAEEQMPALAITDHGNMMGAYVFTAAVDKHNKGVRSRNKEREENREALREQEITPIVGCEFFICADRNDKSHKDNGHQVVLLAKNRKGYHNLAKMASIAFTEGYYYVPRIDKSVVEQYAEDLICLSGNLYGEIPGKILHVGENQAEEALLWWKSLFGDDLYLELMRHGLEEEDHANKIMLDMAKKHEVKVVASNNSYYLNQADANAHDILLCIKEGERQSTPIGKGRGFRYGFPNQEFYFKTQKEMKELFADLPEAIENTNEIAAKCEGFTLARDVLLPKYDIPEQFVHAEDDADGGKRGENAFLKHLTYEGAKKRYGEVTPEIAERLNFELATIERTGYPGYFLIVQDFTTAAREMGVSVGPGRGSAAGSAVAYCIGITNVDPIKYDLLFERFLNPDRVSLPDIDIDFDDEGRQKVIDYVIDKYGSNQVAQIITYGSMAAKSAIRDAGRVLELPLPDTDRVAKLVPDMMKLNKIFGLDDKALKDKLKGNADDLKQVEELKKIAEENTLEGKTVNQARILEGSMRNTGIHACGVIITPDDITNFVPVALAKDSDMYCTQFDNAVVEDAGLLKMDFLGLKTLTLIKDSVRIVKERHDIDLDPDSFPLDDTPTYELFQRGETVGIFQYESAGMQKHMRNLKPTTFADLIAMNALYRPGPLEYIPSFIARKHGDEEIAYDLPEMKEYLEETYGITVYQEQVMLLSQSLAGFTKGQADMLRKGMGKKKKDIIDLLHPKFIEGGTANGHPEEILEKVWTDWEAFASYAFNKSHSTCYAWIAYQTAYLKANYPAEYMAAVLSNNMNDLKKVTFFMEECRRMGVPVLGPDVNESSLKFTVNQEGAVRFGLGALKGVGESAVLAIIDERKENGTYTSVFDLSKRVNLKACNKKAFESLALSGGFDSFSGIDRPQYFVRDERDRPFIEMVVKYGQKAQENENSSQGSLFGESSEAEIPEPLAPQAESWGTFERLRKEKEIIGLYISGHPLDDFKLEIQNMCNASLSDFNSDLEGRVGAELKAAGIITSFQHLTAKSGKSFGKFVLEDYTDSYEFVLFGDDYIRFKEYMMQDMYLFVQAKIQKKRWGDQKAEPKVVKMDMLAELREKLVSNLFIDLDLNAVNNSLISDLHEMLGKYEGKVGVNFNVLDRESRIKVPLKSREMRVSLTNEFIKELDHREYLKYNFS